MKPGPGQMAPGCLLANASRPGKRSGKWSGEGNGCAERWKSTEVSGSRWQGGQAEEWKESLAGGQAEGWKRPAASRPARQGARPAPAAQAPGDAQNPVPAPPKRPNADAQAANVAEEDAQRKEGGVERSRPCAARPALNERANAPRGVPVELVGAGMAKVEKWNVKEGGNWSEIIVKTYYSGYCPLLLIIIYYFIL